MLGAGAGAGLRDGVLCLMFRGGVCNDVQWCSPREQTDASENITFPQSLSRTSNAKLAQKNGGT